MTLGEALLQSSAELPGVEVVDDGKTTRWTVGGRPFAALTDGTAEFRLAPAIRRAALGTPDTAVSPRGADWVAFRPSVLDRFAVDRATAWMASAYRNAAGRRS